MALKFFKKNDDTFSTLYIAKQRDLESPTSTEINNIYAAYAKDQDIYVVYPEDFFVDNGELYVIGRQPNALSIKSLESFTSYFKDKNQLLDFRKPVKDFNIIFSRTVPKTREDIIIDDNANNYLRCIKTLYPNIAMINDPDSISKAGSKIYDSIVLNEVLPTTHITKDKPRIKQILKEADSFVAKPISGLGGRGVSEVDKNKANDSHLDMLLLGGIYSEIEEPRQFILQEKIEGLERRLLLLDGEIIASYGKISSSEDIRGNETTGAQFISYQPNNADIEIVEKISPTLKEDNLHLTAVDILGPELNGDLKNTKVLELNVRCPQWIVPCMNQKEIDEISDKIIDFSEKLYKSKNGK